MPDLPGKVRTSINFDVDVFEGILSMRADLQYARMSISKIVNELIRNALKKKDVAKEEMPQ